MIINDAINHFCIKNDIIPDNQYGFRACHSTIHAINKLISDIQWALNDNKCVGVCLIDLENAFDTVWLDGLIFKLKMKKFPPVMIKLIWNMINNRTFFTYYNNERSLKTYKINNGLQQGTINSPILFNIYTCDILKLFGPHNTECSLIAYADDLIVYANDKKPLIIQKKLQLATEKIFGYYHAWKLRVNTEHR